jgi:hypothetical protein
MACKGQYRGKADSEWFAGKVSAVNGDGTYNVLYDDGDTDKNLRATSVQLTGAAAADGAASSAAAAPVSPAAADDASGMDLSSLQASPTKKMQPAAAAGGEGGEDGTVDEERSPALPDPRSAPDAPADEV